MQLNKIVSLGQAGYQILNYNNEGWTATVIVQKPYLVQQIPYLLTRHTKNEEPLGMEFYCKWIWREYVPLFRPVVGYITFLER